MANGKNGYHQIYPDTLPGTIPDKLAPHSVEAEEALLGSILISADSLVACAEVGLDKVDFFIARHGLIYEAMQSLGRGCDLITLGDELARRGHLDEIGGQPALTQLLLIDPSISHFNAGYYAKIVKRHAVCRQLIDAAGEIARLAHNSDESNPDDITQEASNILLKVSTGNEGDQPVTAEHFCGKFMDRLEEYYNSTGEVIGLPTGLKDLDKLTGGLQPGKLLLVAGRPGMGKSSLAGQMALKNAKAGKNVLYFSLEMLGEELIERMVAAETGIDPDTMRGKKLTGDNWKAINQASVAISKMRLAIDDRVKAVEQIRARAINYRYRHGLDLIILDYIQLVEIGRNYNNRDTEIGEIGKRLKALANDMAIPVVVVSSLSRKCEERGDKRPILSDLRESGSLEYHADQVIMVYRDEVYNSDTQLPGLAEIIVRKNRGGKTGMVQTFFKKHLTTFELVEVRRSAF